jgi:hypothetical protein
MINSGFIAANPRPNSGIYLLDADLMPALRLTDCAKTIDHTNLASALGYSSQASHSIPLAYTQT